MGHRGKAGLFVVLLSGALVALAGPSQARAEAPYVDWATLLPAIGAPYTPNGEPDCADGSNRCIDTTITEMRRRLDGVVPVCDHRAVFALAYLRVTEDVRAARRAGLFADPAWLNREDALFARLYFVTYDAYAAGRLAAVPVAWQLAFDSERKRELSALGDFLMSMNAHINRDMPFMLAAVGLTRPNGTTRKPDHDAYNVRLARLYAPVLREVAARFDPTADDVELGPVDDEAAYVILQSWREGVWRNAERLATARTAAERAQVAASIEAFSATIGRGIRAATQAAPAARDAWCAQHGGQDPERVAAAEHRAAAKRKALAERRAAAKRKALAKRRAAAKRKAALKRRVLAKRKAAALARRRG